MPAPSRRAAHRSHASRRRFRRPAFLGAALLALTLVVAAAVAGSVASGGIQPAVGPLAAAWQPAKPVTDPGAQGVSSQQSKPGAPGAGGTPPTAPSLGAAQEFVIQVKRSAAVPDDLDLTAEFALSPPGAAQVLGTCVTNAAGSCTVSTTQQPSKVAPRGQIIQLQPGEYDLVQLAAPTGTVPAGAVGRLRICAKNANCDAKTKQVDVDALSLFRRSGTVHVRDAVSGAPVENAVFSLTGPAYPRAPHASDATLSPDPVSAAPGDLTFSGWFLPGAYTLNPLVIPSDHLTPAAPLTFTLTTANAVDAAQPWEVVAILEPVPPVVGDGTTGGENPGGDNPGGENPGGENPGGENPGGENPGGENPGGENPGGENPGGENPGGENPGGENPGGENPGGENPGGENPGGENPGGENPGGENPGGDNPGGDNPGVDPDGGPHGPPGGPVGGPPGGPRGPHGGPGGTGGTGSTDGTNGPSASPPGGTWSGNRGPAPDSPSAVADGPTGQPGPTTEDADSGTDGGADVVSAPSIERSPALVPRSNTVLETGLIGFGILVVALVVVGYGWARRRSRR